MAERDGWIRSPIVATLVGLFTGGLVIFLVEGLGHRLFGTAAPGDLASVTTQMFAAVLAAWLLGAFLGSVVATYWARTTSIVPGAIVGAMLLAGAISNMVVIPHPSWMMVAAVLLMPAAAILGARQFASRATA